MRPSSYGFVFAAFLAATTAGSALAEGRNVHAGRPQARGAPAQTQARLAPAPRAGAALGRAGQTAAGSPAVRDQVGRTSAMMDYIIRQNATPPMEIVSATPRARLTQYEASHYHEGRTAKFRVTNLGPGGALDLVTLLPVSGHVGAAEAARYAQTNHYNLVVLHADGRTERLPKVAATGYVTERELSLTLRPGRTRIQFWADGSGGVGGFPSGREIELHWDGN